MLVSVIQQCESAKVYICPPDPWTSFPIPKPSHPSRSSQSTKLSTLCYAATSHLAIYFTYGSAYVSVILSQFVPHFISPALSTSLLSMSASLNSFLIFKGWYNNHYNQFWNIQFILKRNPIFFCSHFPFILNPYKPKQPLIYFPTTQTCLI